MSTEIYLIGMLFLVVVACVFATNNWPDFFDNNDDDPPIFPMA